MAFGGEMPVFEGQKQAEEVLGETMRLYNAVLAEEPEPGLEPPRFREQPLDNFDDDAPVRQWSTGFLRGHQWMSESWPEELPEEVDEELAAAFFTLSFFHSREHAEDFWREEGPRNDKTLEEVVEVLREGFEGAMRSYVGLGKIIYQLQMEFESEEAEAEPPLPKTGRSEPCPCGSGKKFKKCCDLKVTD